MVVGLRIHYGGNRARIFPGSQDEKKLNKKGGVACQWLGNFDMHVFAKYDQNMPCVSRAISIFTNLPRTGGWTD